MRVGSMLRYLVVELDSVVGEGSTFRLLVPLAWRGRPATQLLRSHGHA